MNQWTEYNGEYSKEYYDIKTSEGLVHEQCYPSSGKFHTLKGVQIPEYEVTHIRKTKPPRA